MTGTHPGALRLIAGRLASALKPRPPVRVSEWVENNVVLVDGERAGSLWSASGAPYLVEILDCLSEDHPCNLVTVRKSQQTGASIAALAWVLYVADREPCNMLYVVPGIDTLRDINSGKLQPLIDALHRRSSRRLIAPTVSRSGSGSTTYEKVFARGGRLWLGNANSVMDLSSKTVKKGVKDELSKWEPIPGAQDPEDLFFGRFTAFRSSADWKILEISTPEYDSGDPEGEEPGHCRIDRSFKKSDQRFWHIACPECGSMQYQTFSQFKINERSPHLSFYECVDCGHGITESERRAAIRPENGARWIATMHEPGRHPGFHIDAFCSLMMSYQAIAEDYIKSKNSTIGQKGFYNLVLGLPYQNKGDAPEHEKLLARRDPSLEKGHVPADGLVLTGYADIQMRGIWLEIVAWTPDRGSYLVDALYLGGDTDRPDAEVFDRLRDEALLRRFPDAFGGLRELDALGVDVGYRKHIVGQWVVSNQRQHAETGRDVIFAGRGEDGWGRPPIGQPKIVDIDFSGRKTKQGCRTWPIGTWPLKAQLYTMLTKERSASDFDDIPPGYCHFPAWADEEYFLQLTGESLVDISFRGSSKIGKSVSAGKRWVKTRSDNHFLDCRVGNMALYEHLTAGATKEDWESLAQRRSNSVRETADNLFSGGDNSSRLFYRRESGSGRWNDRLR